MSLIITRHSDEGKDLILKDFNSSLFVPIVSKPISIIFQTIFSINSEPQLINFDELISFGCALLNPQEFEIISGFFFTSIRKIIGNDSAAILYQDAQELAKKIYAKQASNNVDFFIRYIRTLDNHCLNESLAGVYITTNETSLEISRSILTSEPSVDGSVHIGFSGWHNFDIISIRKSSYAVICDFNPNNKRFIEKTLEVIKTSKDRAAFMNKILKYIALTKKNYSVNFYNLKPRDEVINETKREGSWLFTEHQFEYIKLLAMRDAIAAITIDIRSTEIFENLALHLKSENVPVDTVYVSNIGRYMRSEDDKMKYIQTLSKLIQDETLVIHCPKSVEGEAPIQSVDKGKVLKKNHKRYFSSDF